MNQFIGCKLQSLHKHCMASKFMDTNYPRKLITWKFITMINFTSQLRSYKSKYNDEAL